MTFPPKGKALLALVTPLLLFGESIHANTDFLDDLQLLGNDRYIRSNMSASDFMEPAPAPVSPRHSVNVPSSTFKISASLRSGLSNAAQYLQSQNPNLTVAKRGVNVSNRTLSQTLYALLRWDGNLGLHSLQQQFDLLPLANNQTQSSKFTGYYTPMIQASASPDAQYQYPIYRSPMSAQLRRLTRGQISQGALRNKGLEVAWTNDPIGLFYMQIQGSGILQYANGKKVSLHFDGSNEKRFRSLSHFMKNHGLMNGSMGRERIQKWLYANPGYLDQAMNSNPRYVYFKPASNDVLTASGMPIIPGHSVAVDTDYIPFGSVILAEVPILNSKGQTLGVDWKILLPQDRGVAIKGPARMDIYTGTGEQARLIANQLTGKGRAYLLLNKPDTQLSQNMSHTNDNQSAL